ncbi:hypothetical protein D3C72_1159450 [compost metagenome]
MIPFVNPAVTAPTSPACAIFPKFSPCPDISWLVMELAMLERAATNIAWPSVMLASTTPIAAAAAPAVIMDTATAATIATIWPMMPKPFFSLINRVWMSSWSVSSV